MYRRFMTGAACALALSLALPASAQTQDTPPGKSTSAKSKKQAPAVNRAPRQDSRPTAPDSNAGQMTPGTGPALLRGVKDDNM